MIPYRENQDIEKENSSTTTAVVKSDNSICLILSMILSVIFTGTFLTTSSQLFVVSSGVINFSILFVLVVASPFLFASFCKTIYQMMIL